MLDFFFTSKNIFSLMKLAREARRFFFSLPIPYYLKIHGLFSRTFSRTFNRDVKDEIFLHGLFSRIWGLFFLSAKKFHGLFSRISSLRFFFISRGAIVSRLVSDRMA